MGTFSAPRQRRASPGRGPPGAVWGWNRAPGGRRGRPGLKDYAAFSRCTAHTLYSGVLVTGSSAALVIRLAAFSI